MKLNKHLIIIIISIFLVSGCTSVKETLSGQKKKNTDEFLVKKKNPLVLPPNFDDLPEPSEKNIEDKGEEENIDLSEVLSDTENKKKEDVIQNNSLEKSISNILNSN